jgi:hypothetical protein
MMAMVTDNSIAIRRSSRFSTASLKIGQPPIQQADDADDADDRNGSQSLNHTAAASLTRARCSGSQVAFETSFDAER